MTVFRTHDQESAESGTSLCVSRITPNQTMPAYSSQQLFRGATEIEIEHGGARYRLRITRQGKLILNK
jgi:hemin uptake protein HemP